ncbi:uncharacterized protein J3D65DRAFT_153522 [Phyllosticta citribraziliensis]|uniref:Transmembrane protein n=1 Tax=Phyllosticta citribraziliensis TaxID=989973 RepID=A0ABR1L542_9PEZI
MHEETEEDVDYLPTYLPYLLTAVCLSVCLSVCQFVCASASFLVGWLQGGKREGGREHTTPLAKVLYHIITFSTSSPSHRHHLALPFPFPALRRLAVAVLFFSTFSPFSLNQSICPSSHTSSLGMRQSLLDRMCVFAESVRCALNNRRGKVREGR